jgi:hypothetical protein
LIGGIQTMLRGRELQWYMKCKQNASVLHGVTLIQLNEDFVKEIQKPRSEQQSIVEFKEIKQKMGETV